MKKLLYFAIILLPLFLSSQIMDNEYSCDYYEYHNMLDKSKSYYETYDKYITIKINDGYSGIIRIETDEIDQILEYSLNGIKAIDGEAASAILFEDCRLKNDKNIKYSIYIYNKKDDEIHLIITDPNKTIENYKKLIKL